MGKALFFDIDGNSGEFSGENAGFSETCTSAYAGVRT